jgi:hypothetical protein
MWNYRQVPRIDWKYFDTSAGGIIHLQTRDTEALNAIHEFLLCQIREHQTGDPESIR